MDTATASVPGDYNACKNFLQVSCNWKINNEKEPIDAVTTMPAYQKPKEIEMDDVVDLATCICVESVESNDEPCTVDIKVTNGRRISHIAVVSGAYILEFFKQYGEYETTVVIEPYVDEDTKEPICFGETAISPFSTEASIKFAKRVNKNSSFWIYGIKLFLTDPIQDSKQAIFNLDTIKSFLSKCAISKETDTTEAKNPSKELALKSEDILGYIDNKFEGMEARLSKRIDMMEDRINQKLDTLLQQVQSIAPREFK